MAASYPLGTPTCFASPGSFSPPPFCAQGHLLHEHELIGKRVSGCRRCVAGHGHSFRCFPAAIIIGVMKGGTTELLADAKRNPNIFAASREMHFFGSQAASHLHIAPSKKITTPVWHDYLWNEGTTVWGAKSVLEGSAFTLEKTPDYIRKPHALAEIAWLLPTVRLVLLLREPASRAYSHFRMAFATKHSQLSDFLSEANIFHEHIASEVSLRCAAAVGRAVSLQSCSEVMLQCSRLSTKDSRCRKFMQVAYVDTNSGGGASSWIERGVYAGAIQRLRVHFNCSQVTIILSEAFRVDPINTLRSLWQSLGVRSGKLHPTEIAPRIKSRFPEMPMHNSTMTLLRSFYSADVRDLVHLLPALRLRHWWSYHH